MSDTKALLKEKRVFEPGSGFAKRANWSKKTVNAYRKLGERDPERFWAKMAREHVSWFSPWKRVLDWKPPFAQLVRRRQAQRLLQLPRPSSRGQARLAPQQGGDHLGGRARRHARAHLRRAAPRGLPLRERPAGARRVEGRPRRDLHADDPRARDRDPRLRADRRAPQRRLRRLLRRGAARPHQRRRGEAGGDRRRRLPARRGEPAQARRRRGARGGARAWRR